jgi:SET domain-containing protein
MNYVEETDLRFSLAPSTIPNAGLGCFAKEDLKKGDHIEVIGVYVKKGGPADRCTSYASRYKFSGNDKQDTHIVPMGYAGMINHTQDSSKQNVKLEFVRGLATRSKDSGQVVYRFLRDIKAGEELLGHYGEDKDKEIRWLSERAEYHDKEGALWQEFLSLNLYNLGLLAKI